MSIIVSNASQLFSTIFSPKTTTTKSNRTFLLYWKQTRKSLTVTPSDFYLQTCARTHTLTNCSFCFVFCWLSAPLFSPVFCIHTTIGKISWITSEKRKRRRTTVFSHCSSVFTRSGTLVRLMDSVHAACVDLQGGSPCDFWWFTSFVRIRCRELLAKEKEKKKHSSV